MRRIRNKQSSAKNEAKAKVDNSRQTHSATLNEKENCFYFVFSFFLTCFFAFFFRSRWLFLFYFFVFCVGFASPSVVALFLPVSVFFFFSLLLCSLSQPLFVSLCDSHTFGLQIAARCLSLSGWLINFIYKNTYIIRLVILNKFFPFYIFAGELKIFLARRLVTDGFQDYSITCEKLK